MCVCWRWSVFWQPVCSAWSSKGPRTPPGIKARWDVRLQLSIKSHDFKLQIASYRFKISGGVCIALFYYEHSLWFLTQALFTRTLTLILMNTSGECICPEDWTIWDQTSHSTSVDNLLTHSTHYMHVCNTYMHAGRCCGFSTVSKTVEKKLFLYQLWWSHRPSVQPPSQCSGFSFLLLWCSTNGKWLIYTDIRRFTWPDNNIDLRNPKLECLYLFYIWHFCAVYSGYAGKNKYTDDVDVWKTHLTL